MTVLETNYRVFKMKKFLDGFFSLLDTAKRKTSKFEDRSIEINQTELQWENLKTKQ